jgi:hypothetical protein
MRVSVLHLQNLVYLHSKQYQFGSKIVIHVVFNVILYISKGKKVKVKVAL